MFRLCKYKCARVSKTCIGYVNINVRELVKYAYTMNIHVRVYIICIYYEYTCTSIHNMHIL